LLAFIKYIEKRIKEGRKLNFDWDQHEKNKFGIPVYSEEYRLPVGLMEAEQYIEKLELMETEIKKIEKDKVKISKEIKKLKTLRLLITCLVQL